MLCQKMQPAVLLFLGGLATVAGYSAQNTYEELDQNVPFITWATLAMQAVGMLLIGAALYRVSPVRDMWLWLGLGALFLMFSTSVAGLYTSNILVSLLDLASGLLLAASIGRGSVMPSFVAAVSAVVLVSSKRMVLPFEEERRVAHGPGMALLTLAWLGLAWAVMLASQSVQSSTVTQVSLQTPNYPATSMPTLPKLPGGVPDYGLQSPVRSFSLPPSPSPMSPQLSPSMFP